MNDSLQMLDLSDLSTWRVLLQRGTAEQAPAAFTPTTTPGAASISSAARKHLTRATSDSSIGHGLDTLGAPTTATALETAVGAVGVGGGGAVEKRAGVGGWQKGATAGAGARASGRDPGHIGASSYEQDLFKVVAGPSLEALVVLWEHCHEDSIVTRYCTARRTAHGTAHRTTQSLIHAIAPHYSSFV